MYNKRVLSLPLTSTVFLLKESSNTNDIQIVFDIPNCLKLKKHSVLIERA